MKGVGVVCCPKVQEYHYGPPINPGLLRNCAVCFSYAGETETHIYCNYPMIKILEKDYEPEIDLEPEEWENDAMEMPSAPCPECDGEIISNERYCRWCGTKIDRSVFYGKVQGASKPKEADGDEM